MSKGPFTYKRQKNSKVFGSDTYVVNQFGPVAFCRGEANARLIAAAPDLLAACELLIVAENQASEELNYNLLAEATEVARAAIEKAGSTRRDE